MRVNLWIQGQLSSYLDMNAENETMFEFAALFAQMMIGSNSINSTENPLVCAAVAGTMNVNVGGTNQVCVVQGRVANEIAATVLTIAPNATSEPRTDLIVAQFVENSVAPFTRNVRQPDTTIVPETVYNLAQSLEFQVVEGSGSSLGTIPSGYVEVGRVVVPPESATLGSSAAHATLPTLMSFLIGVVVQSLNGLVGAITLASEDDSILITTSGGNVINLAAGAASAAVTSLAGLINAITLASPDASIGISVVGQQIRFVNNGVKTVNGASGAITNVLQGLTSVDNTVGISGSGSVRDLSIAAVGGYAAGQVQYRLRYDYSGGTNEGPLPTSSSQISPLGSLLGSTPQSTGVPSVIESVFHVKVKPGSGAQTIGGGCNQSGGFVAVYVDGTSVASQSSPAGDFTWSASIPDDNAYHTVILHCNDTGSAGINNIWSAFLPQNTYGGLDLTKILAVIPGP